MITRLKFRYSIFGLVLMLSQQIFAQSLPEVRVMTYNIRYKNTIDSVNGWDYRKDNVAALIKYHQADIVGLQEATLEQINDLEKRMPEYKWYGVPRVSGKNGEYTPIFYRKDRYSLLESGSFWYSETPHVKESKSWDAMYPRIASWSKFRDKRTGVEFFFFNTHLDHRGEIARQQSAKILRHEIDSIAADSPVIVTGDFNSQPSSVAYKNMIENDRLEDALNRTLTPHYGPVNSAGGFLVSNKPIWARIDYIFVNKKVRVLQHATITDQQEGRYYSDHLPVLAVIDMK